MEVHAHTHTPRKKWTHYFWEFLMLFLAVFCGFLAENQREHIVEGNRAKEYAKSLLIDLDLDTSELRRGIQHTKFVITAIDSVVSISSKSGRLVPGSFYYYNSFTSGAFHVDWGKSTIDQLIQSGNLRYFRNKRLVALINTYYYMAGIISRQNGTDAVHRDKVTELRNGILLSRYYPLFLQKPNAQGNVSFHPVDSLNKKLFPIQKDGDQQMDKYIITLLDRKNRLINIAGTYYPNAQELALEIMETINEEYNLSERSVRTP